MRTTRIPGNGGYNHGERFRRDDGATLTVGYIGRCWVYHLARAGVPTCAQYVSGRECDDVAGKLRRQFARDTL